MPSMNDYATVLADQVSMTAQLFRDVRLSILCDPIPLKTKRPKVLGRSSEQPSAFKIGCSGLAAPKGQFKSLRRCLPNSGTTLGEASHFRLAAFES